MTVVVVLLAVVVALLAFLVAGLLRSHAVILRRLHELGAGVEPAMERGPADPEDVDLGLPQPTTVTEGRTAADVSGASPHGDAQAVRIAGVEHDTVVAFLSSGCQTCHVFWDELRDAALPSDTRLVVVTKGEDAESPVAVADLAPPGVTVIMSSQAWADYEVPGSPYVIHVDGPSGRVRGEGTGPSWRQVQRMLLQGAGDLDARRTSKAAGDAARERDADEALLAAGIRPGDPSLYVQADGTTVEPSE